MRFRLADSTVAGFRCTVPESAALPSSAPLDCGPVGVVGARVGGADIAGGVVGVPAPADFLDVAGGAGKELTAEEYYLFILMADNGGQFYSRENGGSY